MVPKLFRISSVSYLAVEVLSKSVQRHWNTKFKIYHYSYTKEEKNQMSAVNPNGK